MLGTIFMQNLIRNDIDSDELVNRLSFNVPVSPFPFYVLIITTFIV